MSATLVQPIGSKLRARLTVPAAAPALRIAFIADTLEAGIGGGVIAARHLVEELRQEHEVVVVGADAGADERFTAFPLPFRAIKDIGFVLARPARLALRRILARVDVVHLQFPFWLSFAALKEAKRIGLPVLAAFHVQPENALLSFGVQSSWLSRVMYRGWIKAFFNRADAVLCPTQFAKRRLLAHGLKTRSFVVSNGVPPDVTPGRPQRDPSHRGKFLIVMAGRLAAEKRQEVLLEAVRHSRHIEQIRIVIAGAGPREDALKRLGGAFPYPPEIGFLPREQLVQLLRSADLFVHCGEVELEGVAVIEAMSIGLPVLVADAPESAASTFALDNRFRFPAGDFRALAARIDALIECPALLRHARQRYRDKARELDFPTSVSRLVQIYQSLIA